VARAGLFFGAVEVRGDIFAKDLDLTNITCRGDISLPGQDCAENFEISGSTSVEAGTVMVIDDEGCLTEGRKPYDTRVAGVISGAGAFKPAIVLGRTAVPDIRQAPVALVGKVFCKVDAEYCSISVGDLLTTSGTPGHAMRIADPSKAVGAVLGKALRPLESGRGLIPILVTLQ
jgi:hypothetical protein